MNDKIRFAFEKSLHGFLCNDDKNFQQLYVRAVHIAQAGTAHNSALDGATQCLTGSFDTASLHQAAIELGYLQPGMPLHNFNRFAENFAPYANSIGETVNDKADEYSLAFFQDELELEKNIYTARVFTHYTPEKLPNISSEQWTAFDALFLHLHHYEREHFELNDKYAPAWADAGARERHRDVVGGALHTFLLSINLSQLGDPETLNTLLARAKQQKINLEDVFTALMDDFRLPPAETEALVAAYLTQHPELVSAEFLLSIVNNLDRRTPALQEAVLGKPREAAPALLHTVLEKTRKELVAAEHKTGPFQFEDAEAAHESYAELIYRTCLLGHPDALLAFENVLQNKNDTAYQPYKLDDSAFPEQNRNSYSKGISFPGEPHSLAALLQTIAAGDMPHQVRADLQSNFREFSSRMRVLFPTLYRQANAPAVIFLARLIASDEGHEQKPKKSMAAFEAAYQANQLANDKEYSPPSYNNFGELLSNDVYEKRDRGTLYRAMNMLMKGDETDKILTQFEHAINAGSQASPEILEYFLEYLIEDPPSTPKEKAKNDIISTRMAEFLDRGLNADSYLRWLKPLQHNLTDTQRRDLMVRLTKNMGEIGTNLNDIFFKATKPNGYSGLYEVYAKMTEQYWPTIVKEYPKTDSPAETLNSLDEKGLYTTQKLSPLALLKKFSMSDDEKIAEKFYYQLKENFNWFHGGTVEEKYPEKNKLPTRQEEYRNAMREIAENVNHHTQDAIGALVQKTKEASPFTKTFQKLCQELKLNALKEKLINNYSKGFWSEFWRSEKMKLFSELALLGNTKAIPTLFELWNYDELIGLAQGALVTLLRRASTESTFLPKIKAEILARAEAALKHPGRHDAALSLINYAAQHNVEGSFEILERIALQESADSDAALKTLFTPHEGEVPLELEQVRQRFLDDWRDRLANDNVDEEELQHLRDLAGDDGTIIMNELSGALNDYEQRKIEKTKAEEAKKAAEEAAKNMRSSASSVVTVAPSATAKPSDKQENSAAELYEIIVDEGKAEAERLQALAQLSRRANSNAEALQLLAATLWDVDDETLIDSALAGLIEHSNNSFAALELISSVIEGCEQGFAENQERCQYILEYLASTDASIDGIIRQWANDALQTLKL